MRSSPIVAAWSPILNVRGENRECPMSHQISYLQHPWPHLAFMEIIGPRVVNVVDGGGLLRHGTPYKGKRRTRSVNV